MEAMATLPQPKLAMGAKTTSPQPKLVMEAKTTLPQPKLAMEAKTTSPQQREERVDDGRGAAEGAGRAVPAREAPLRRGVGQPAGGARREAGGTKRLQCGEAQ
eukprot:gene1447-biopygen45